MTSITAQPVVCGVDDSSEARVAARVAGELARRLDVALVLTHVATPASMAATPASMGGVAAAHASAAYIEEVEERARRDGRVLVDEIARTLPLSAATELLAGDAVSALGELAAERDAALLVVGAHARGALGRAVTGTAWCRLAVENDRPVAVVSSRAETSVDGPVVVGFDGSAHSERAVVFAAMLAGGLAQPLIVVKVVDDTETGPPLDGFDAFDARGVVRRGEPHEQLARVADEHGASLIVVGSRGRGPWRAAVLGSVSAKLVEVASRPVVIVPSPA